MLTWSEASNLTIQDSVDGAWRILREFDGAVDPSLCLCAVDTILRDGGLPALQQAWPDLPDAVLVNVAYAGGRSLEMSEWIFDTPRATTHIRHLLVAGLVAALRRSVVPRLERIAALLGRIGRYDDPRRQAILDRFTRSAVAEISRIRCREQARP